MPLSSNDRFRSALRAAKTVVWDLDLRSGQTVRSGSSLEILGIPSGTGDDFARLVHPQDRPRVDAALAAAYAGEATYDIELRVTCPDGTLRWIHEIAEVYRNEAGRPVRLCGVTVDITARKQTEQELTRYRMLSAHGRDILLFFRTDGTIVDVNEAAVAAYGYSREELLGRPFQDLRAEATRAEIPAQMKRVEHGPLRFETIHRRKDGTTFPVEATWSFAAVGTEKIILSIVRDTTERQRAEAALRAAHDSFRHLVEQSPFGVYTVGADFRLAQVSAGAQRVFANVHPLLGRDFAEVLRVIWPEPFASEAIARFHHTLETGDPYHSPGTVERRQDIDEVESYDWKIERVTLPDGRPGVVCHFYDLSERQRYEAALRGSELRFRTLADGAPALVWQDDAEGRTIYVNRVWEEFTGLPEAAGLGEGWSGLVHPEDRERFRAAYFGAVARRQPYQAEYRMRRHDGAWRWMLDTATPLAETDGRVTGFIGLALDITERKEAEERQQLLAREVDHRAKNLLAVVLSILHLSRAPDIDTYIAAVQGRVMALARAHSLLARSRWMGADLGRLVADELAPYRQNQERVATSGPVVNLQPAASQSLALALHELATNAAKYGALSVPAGRLAVSWEVTAEGLTLRWSESGGPAVRSPPTRKGFGNTVLTASVAQQLDGRVALDWRPEGLRAALFVPSAQLTYTAAPVAAESAPASPEAGVALAPAPMGNSRSAAS
ncbi:MAG: PAS domain S-box protein [Dongiaceae bacterium]